MPALASVNDIYRVRTNATGIIKRALRLIGVLASGEELPAHELTDGVEALNDMMDSWNTEKLIIFALARNTFTLTGGQNPHTLGPAGDLDAPRPQRIDEGLVYLSGGTLGSNEVPLKVYDAAHWGAILDKTQSGIPWILYYDSAFPLGNVWLYSKPDAAYTLILYQEQMLAQVFMDSVTSDILLPPGYKEALTHNLAIRLAPEYGKEIPLAVADGAVEGKARIKRANMKPLYIGCDAALVRPGGWSIETGDYI